MTAAKNFVHFNPGSHLAGYYRNLVKAGMSVTESRKRVARALVRVFFRVLHSIDEKTNTGNTECADAEREIKRENDMANGQVRSDKNHESNISLSPLTSISTVLQRANAEAFMSVACQEKAILRRLPPNHGIGVGSSARPEATR